MRRNTRFGFMIELRLPRLSRNCEVMCFERTGSPHVHEDRDEVAIAVAGTGIVWVGEEAIPVEPGSMVEIPAGEEHYMEPGPNGPLSMLITYKASNPTFWGER